MHFSEAALLGTIGAIAWPMVRIGALLLAAPLFGARTVPMRVRAALALVLALLVAPLIAVQPEVTPWSAAGLLLLLREALIGFGLGFLLQMVFSAMAMAGEMVALSMGLAFASMVDPERGGSVPLVGQYYVIFATLLFVALDGHLALLMLLVESFSLLPPAHAGLGSAGFRELVWWFGQMFQATVLVALPASAALLVASVSMGLIARSAPQLNIFAVGFPMTLMLGLTVLLLGLPALAGQFESVLQLVLDQARQLLGAWQ